MHVLFDMLVWSPFIALLLFLGWPGWVSLGILGLSALLHRRTRGQVYQLPSNASLWELLPFFGVPLLILSVGVFIPGTDNSMFLIILGLEVSIAVLMLWRHRQRLVQAWILLTLASLWSISAYFFVSGQIEAW